MIQIEQKYQMLLLGIIVIVVLWWMFKRNNTEAYQDSMGTCDTAETPAKDTWGQWSYANDCRVPSIVRDYRYYLLRDDKNSLQDRVAYVDPKYYEKVPRDFILNNDVDAETDNVVLVDEVDIGQVNTGAVSSTSTVQTAKSDKKFTLLRIISLIFVIFLIVYWFRTKY